MKARTVCCALGAAALYLATAAATPVPKTTTTLYNERDGSALAKRSLLPPSQDPFYAPPPDLARLAPGTIINHRSVTSSLAALARIPLDVHGAWQILYASTDSTGMPEAAVTTVIVPFNADLRKVLSYQIAYDSASVDCSPSYALRLGASLESIATQDEIFLIAAALEQGWVVSTPDYEGPKAAFTAGPQAGHATLDSLRAVLRSGRFTGVSPNATIAMWGYSGGALAAEWAAELQSSYAPELSIAGAALGGLTPDVLNVFKTINNGPFAGLGPAGVLGMARDYQNMSTFLDNSLVPSKAAEFRKAGTQCLAVDAIDFAFQNITSYFKQGQGALSLPVPNSVVQACGIMGLHGTPQIPLYVYKADYDEVSPVGDTNALVSKYCSKGVTIHYERNLVAEHATLMVFGAPGALSWLINLFNGKQPNPGCHTDTVLLDALQPDAIYVLGALAFAGLTTLLGQPIGPI